MLNAQRFQALFQQQFFFHSTPSAILAITGSDNITKNPLLWIQNSKACICATAAGTPRIPRISGRAARHPGTGKPHKAAINAQILLTLMKFHLTLNRVAIEGRIFYNGKLRRSKADRRAASHPFHSIHFFKKERVSAMNMMSHLDSMQEKHAQIEQRILEEMHHPLPDFTVITQLKKQKLILKEQIESLLHQQQAASSA
jgi:hypothetical protein